MFEYDPLIPAQISSLTADDMEGLGDCTDNDVRQFCSYAVSQGYEVARNLDGQISVYYAGGQDGELAENDWQLLLDGAFRNRPAEEE